MAPTMVLGTNSQFSVPVDFSLYFGMMAQSRSCSWKLSTSTSWLLKLLLRFRRLTARARWLRNISVTCGMRRLPLKHSWLRSRHPSDRLSRLR